MRGFFEVIVQPHPSELGSMTKIEQQPYFKSGRLQIVEQLSLVDSVERPCRLQLHDNSIRNDQVGSKQPNSHSSEYDFDGLPLCASETSSPKRDNHGFPIN
jgi:hypothetical protein